MSAAGISLKALRRIREYSQKLQRDSSRWPFPPSDGNNDVLLPLEHLGHRSASDAGCERRGVKLAHGIIWHDEPTEQSL